jgi:PAS domain S-box-containing protein
MAYRLLLVNRPVREGLGFLLNLKDEEFIGKTYRELGFPDEQCNYWEACLQKVHDTGTPLQTEYAFDTPFGTNYYEWQLIPELDQDGNTVSILAVSRDITERKGSENALRESEELFRTLADTTSTGIVIIQGERIISGNRASEMLSGYTIDELLNMHFWDLYHPEYQDLVRQRGLARQRGEPVPKRYEVKIVRKDGEARWIDFSAGMITWKGQPAIVGTYVDITERKRAEEALSASESELRALFTAMQDVVLVIDREGVYRKIAPNNPALLHREPEELLGKKLEEVFPTEQAKKFLSIVHQVLQKQQSVRVEYDLSIGGKSYWFSTLISPMTADSTVWVARDITELKQTEAQLKSYSERLEEMVKERTRALEDAQEQLVRQERLAVLGQLAGGVGHELRNPLGVINNAIYYLKLVQPDADEKVRSYHAMIEQEVHTAEKIISDLLDFARIKSMDREPVAIHELVQRVLVRYPVPASVEVSQNIPSDLPRVFADSRHLEQVLGNLVVNAYQAMAAHTSLGQTGSTDTQDGGRLTITACQQGEMILIAVKDNGVGIPPQNMNKLFEPLFTTKTTGIGLGLAVSQKLAEANGGRIEFESELGKGATFTLYIPAAR